MPISHVKTRTALNQITLVVIATEVSIRDTYIYVRPRDVSWHTHTYTLIRIKVAIYLLSARHTNSLSAADKHGRAIALSFRQWFCILSSDRRRQYVRFENGNRCCHRRRDRFSDLFYPFLTLFILSVRHAFKTGRVQNAGTVTRTRTVRVRSTVDGRLDLCDTTTMCDNRWQMLDRI